MNYTFIVLKNYPEGWLSLSGSSRSRIASAFDILVQELLKRVLAKCVVLL